MDEAEWIRDALKARPDKTQVGLAAALGVAPSAVSRLLAGQRRLKAAEIAPAAAYLGVSPPPSMRAAQSVAGAGSEFALASILSDGLVGDRDLPVYGSAQGGPGDLLLIEPEPAEFVRRPEPLFGVSRGFGVYIYSDSMVPAFEAGDIALVHPQLPLQRGRHAIIFGEHQRSGFWAAVVKTLVRWTTDDWTVKQYNPEAEYTLPRADWQNAYRTVGRYERR